MTRDELIEAVRARAAADPCVAALFLSGSLGAGAGDRFSDCDFVLAVHPDRHATFVDGLRAWVGEFVEPVLWRQLYPGVPLFHAITPDYVRFDLTVTVPGKLAGSRETWRPLVDPGKLHRNLVARTPARDPDPAKITAIVEEFWRILGLLPVAAGRGDYVVGASGAGFLRDQLIALLIEGHAPPVHPGALALARVLHPEESELVASLPPVCAERQAVIDASLACAAAFLPRARALADSTGAAWPGALEAAARAHIRRELGREVPD